MHHELPSRLDLEWYRKQAKGLVRAYAAGDANAVARVEETLGDRARERFRLSDAQWVIAQEHGHRSWAEFACWVGGDPGRAGMRPSGSPLATAFEAARATWGERGAAELATGLTYDGVEPVLVHVTKRERRYEFSDGGAASRLAGRPAGWREAADAIEAEYVVNVSRQGVVFLPAVERSGLRWLAALPDRIASGSLALYGALLELDE
jgi:hypothetical protein